MRGQDGYFWPSQGSIQTSREGLGSLGYSALEVGAPGLGPRTKLLQFPQL